LEDGVDVLDHDILAAHQLTVFRGI
jgi:hypothetical protein